APNRPAPPRTAPQRLPGRRRRCHRTPDPSPGEGRVTWRAWACSASASWGSWPSCPRRVTPIDLGLGGRLLPQGRDDLPPVDLDLLLLASVHQVQVELGHAGLGQGPQPLDVLVRRPDEAEAVDDLVGDEGRVRAADLGVMEVVVALP